MADECLFCRIIKGSIPADKVYEDETVLAFRDIQPQAPTHILVIPKTHVSSVATTKDPGVLGNVMRTAAKIAEQANLTETGYRLVTNHGNNGGQTVPHLHIHLLGGRQLTWPPG